MYNKSTTNIEKCRNTTSDTNLSKPHYFELFTTLIPK